MAIKSDTSSVYFGGDAVSVHVDCSNAGEEPVGASLVNETDDFLFRTADNDGQPYLIPSCRAQLANFGVRLVELRFDEDEVISEMAYATVTSCIVLLQEESHKLASPDVDHFGTNFCPQTHRLLSVARILF